MIREAEIQSADVVAGSYVNENGHWKNSCFQFNIRPWELTIDNGYHKSLRGAMYCDGSFGPLLLSIWILLIYFIENHGVVINFLFFCKNSHLYLKLQNFEVKIQIKMRKSAFKKLLELATEELDQIKLHFFLRNRDLRFIAIPDCMFYVKEKPKILRYELMKLAQTFSFNKISLESDTYEFTCQEEGASNQEIIR